MVFILVILEMSGICKLKAKKKNYSWVLHWSWYSFQNECSSDNAASWDGAVTLVEGGQKEPGFPLLERELAKRKMKRAEWFMLYEV